MENCLKQESLLHAHSLCCSPFTRNQISKLMAFKVWLPDQVKASDLCSSELLGDSDEH